MGRAASSSTSSPPGPPGVDLGGGGELAEMLLEVCARVFTNSSNRHSSIIFDILGRLGIIMRML